MRGKGACCAAAGTASPSSSIGGSMNCMSLVSATFASRSGDTVRTHLAIIASSFLLYLRAAGQHGSLRSSLSGRLSAAVAVDELLVPRHRFGCLGDHAAHRGKRGGG